MPVSINAVTVFFSFKTLSMSHITSELLCRLRFVIANSQITRGSMYLSRNIEAHARITVAVEKQEVLLIGLCVHERQCVRACVRACGYPGAWVCACAYVHVTLLSSMQRVCAILLRHLWLLWLHHIFRHYLINGAIFENKLLNVKCVF